MIVFPLEVDYFVDNNKVKCQAYKIEKDPWRPAQKVFWEFFQFEPQPANIPKAFMLEVDDQKQLRFSTGPDSHGFIMKLRDALFDYCSTHDLSITE